MMVLRTVVNTEIIVHHSLDISLYGPIDQFFLLVGVVDNCTNVILMDRLVSVIMNSLIGVLIILGIRLLM